MISQKNKAVIEDDVTFTPGFTSVYDYNAENIYPGCKMPIWWGDDDNHTQDEIDVNNFIGWMFETGRIDNYHTEGDGLVEIDADHYEYDICRYDFVCTRKGTFHYTFRQFVRDCATESDFVTYKNCLS